MTDTTPQEHLYDLLKDFSTAMLISRDADGRMHARPMAVADLQRDADAYFVTRVESTKVDEIQNFPEVLITFQGPSRYASVVGQATLVHDRQLIEQLWSEAWRVWFPEGKDDPDLVLIKVDARDGEYWDNSGFQGIKYAFEGAKALLTGETPETDKWQHSKLKLVR